ncbi:MULTISPECIES: alpha/beta hydrolase [Paraburkholderia]|uniref:alpha/beta hydrolase n=1 Tax=Paraburkholderia TaxID=1822464 RepID=UPI00285F3CA5|nr:MULTISPECIES: alpha/beta fold hydrolase [Paraburkholderia]MDR6388930.1 esterase/lipase [Paraburkholderia phenoliruptrix]MDR6419241.1 esterase/lipase [Paraburkholderia phenoliruptrix]
MREPWHRASIGFHFGFRRRIVSLDVSMQALSRPGAYSRIADFVKIVVVLASVIVETTLFAGCAATKNFEGPVSSVSFADYQSETLETLRTKRSFQSEDHEAEMDWNAPKEWQPISQRVASRPEKGILLVHGLGDSPWSFRDLAQRLAAQGFLVRTVLLPGHGTKPDDLLTVTAEDWQRVVWEQAQALQRDVKEVYLGGFSTGCNLVLEYAYAHPEIAGLVLFSPGFKTMPFDWLAPLITQIRPWLVKSDGSMPMQTPVRYMNVPTNGFAQFYRTSVIARRLLRNEPYDKPVFMVVAQHDSVLNTQYLLDVFQRRFTNPRSRLIWYGEKPSGPVDAARILIRPDKLPGLRISQFSHMGLLFSPMNPLYGEKGSLRICLNGQTERATQSCEHGAPVWYSDWGHREDGKVHARLTFNPYFDWQTSVMMMVLGDRAAAESSASDPSAAVPVGGAGPGLPLPMRHAATFK